MHHARTEERRPVVTRVKLTWENDSGQSVSQTALVVDRSLGGAGIAAHTPIPAGTHLSIKERTRTLTGTVRYCRPTGQEYAIGVQYEEKDAAWSKPLLTSSPILR